MSRGIYKNAALTKRTPRPQTPIINFLEEIKLSKQRQNTLE